MFFLLSFLTHTRLQVVHGVQEGIRNDLTTNANFAYNEPVPFQLPRVGNKNLFDIYSVTDVYTPWEGFGTYRPPEGTAYSELKNNYRALGQRIYRIRFLNGSRTLQAL